MQQAIGAILDPPVAAVVAFAKNARVLTKIGSNMPNIGEAAPLVLECRRGAGASSAIGEKGGASWLDHLTATTELADTTFRISRRNSCAAIPLTGNNTPGLPARAASTCNPQIAAKWRVHGALNFPIDPDLSARSHPAIWQAGENPNVVILSGSGAVAARAACDLIAKRTSNAGDHLVLAGGGARHRLLVMASARLGGDNYLIPQDQSVPIRLAALDAFHCCVAGSAVPTKRYQLRPTTYQSQRLRLLLAILDTLGRAPEGVTLREIAGTLVYRGLSAQRAIDWKSSSQRRQTQRLVAEARRMASHGYLDLLRQSRFRPFQTH